MTRPMRPRRLSLKLFVDPAPADAAGVDLAPFIPLFHRFIQHGSVEGLLVDVADYAHVPHGPGVLLVGHEVDYGIDSTGGRPGLLVVRKRAGELPLAELLRDTLRRAYGAAAAIEADGGAGVRFAPGAFELRVMDRLAAPNGDEAFENLLKETEPVLREVFGGEGLALERAGGDDPRQALGLAARVPADSVAAVAERLGAVRAGEPAPMQAEWEIEVDELRRLREQGAAFVLVDVREHHEYAAVNLGGRHIPLGSLSGRLDELERDAHVVVHCKMGARGAEAVRILRGAGFGNAWNLRGGLDAWIERIDPDLASS